MDERVWIEGGGRSAPLAQLSVRVVARLSGDFKGSPVELESRFELRDGRIARLEIG